MSDTWNRHYQAISDLIAANPVRRYTPPPTPAPVTPTLPTENLGGMGPAGWQGGANGGGYGADAAPAAGTSGGGGGWSGGFPNASTLASHFDVSPAASRAGLTALGLMNPALGMAISGMGLVGNAVNTTNNVGMLNGLGVNPGAASTIGGLLGFNGLSGNMTSALNAAMANQYSGFSNLSPAQMPGDFSTSGWGGWGDIAAAMGPTSENAPLGAVEVAAMSNPGDLSGAGPQGMGDFGLGTTEGWQKGGYTGAGRDGKVQPDRVAGVVHEGEYVIPHHMVRRMGLLGR